MEVLVSNCLVCQRETKHPYYHLCDECFAAEKHLRATLKSAVTRKELRDKLRDAKKIPLPEGRPPVHVKTSNRGRHITCAWCGHGIVKGDRFLKWQWVVGTERATFSVHTECWERMVVEDGYFIKHGGTRGDRVITDSVAPTGVVRAAKIGPTETAGPEYVPSDFDALDGLEFEEDE